MAQKLSMRGWQERDVIAERIRERAPFRTHGAFYGETDGIVSRWHGGQLPGALLGSAKTADYTVFSYDTPIAWHGPDGWTVPNVRYSITTSKHQGLVRQALNLGWSADMPTEGGVAQPTPGGVKVARDGVAVVPSSTGGVWAG